MTEETKQPTDIPAPPKRGKVNVRHYGNLLVADDDDNAMTDWPNATQDGYDFMGMLAAEGFDFRGDDANDNQKDSAYWKAAVRWALLKKYGYLEQVGDDDDDDDDALNDPFVIVEDNGKAKTKQRTLQFSQADSQRITSLWNDQCQLAKSSTNKDVVDKDDLHQFLRTNGLSNHRPMQWSFLDCGPACQFQLHAHPNIEVIYCLKGELHEIRMDGAPVTKEFQQQQQQQQQVQTATNNEDNNNNNSGNKPKTTAVLKGPDLSNLQRPWKFYTLRQGEFLVNEVGSIHKSFSATNGNGCQLLVCWGGSHADVTQDMEPTSVSVQGALEFMDQRLSSSCGCVGDDNSVQPLSETFLPVSDRSDATPTIS